MPDRNNLNTRIKALVDERVALETKLQNEKGELSHAQSTAYNRSYMNLQRQLAVLFKDAREDQQRVTIMLEILRILENRLVYLQNFVVDANSDNRILAQL